MYVHIHKHKCTIENLRLKFTISNFIAAQLGETWIEMKYESMKVHEPSTTISPQASKTVHLKLFRAITA